MRKGLVAILLVGCVLSACSDEGFPEIVEEEKKITHHVGEQAVISTYSNKEYTWHETIYTIANNGASAEEKFEELERFSVNYVTNAHELDQFIDTLITQFETNTYLQNLTDHQDVLTRIFQAFIVERNATGPLKDFSAAYFANLTGVYVDQVSTDHRIILHNQDIMHDMMSQYKEDKAA
ncbi:hypothetical protein [Caryophanon latum]|uniref:Uncharacterized protein n=1 Tax=Caryophanon latum TaxID=33977 RepID=A0A1C0YAY1_9BACL|nr:hypothetical protein [Caryophanon latum]OCS84346.1 hypothetical protein A6K76_15685 [Caryophanon latum]